MEGEPKRNLDGRVVGAFTQCKRARGKPGEDQGKTDDRRRVRFRALAQAYDVVRTRLEMIRDECGKYKEFEVVKLIGKHAAEALRDADVILREAEGKGC